MPKVQRVGRGARCLAIIALAIAAPTTPAPAESVAAESQSTNRCHEFDPERNVYWGDLHVHTAYSMDAWVFDTRLTPDDAYRFARGEEVALPPFDASGRGTTAFRIDRPLDFAAVTDHAHSFGGVRLCTDPASPAFGTPICQRYRRPFLAAGDLAAGVRDIVERIDSLRAEELCGADGGRCRAAAERVWRDSRDAAARWNDEAPSCRFTTFVGYEYTATPDLTKIHRNVIFGSDRVPEAPITWDDEPEAVGLWEALDRQCVRGLPGCDVIAIPHNPNLSNGRMFTIEYPDGTGRPEQARLAGLRARMEPVVEMMQIKGESECRSGLWKVLGSDEECGFEKYRREDEGEDCEDGTGAGALARRGCRSRLDFARYALIEGLREADRIGVNPYAFGLIGSTDIHTGTPGAVAEWATESLGETPPAPGSNLGGLAAVWAEENSRAALFAALKRREVYATSGPRMTVRLFGGWRFPDDLCGSADLVRRGYAEGVPMGSDLPPREPADAAPVFVVSAMRDPGTESHPGTLLQRIQIVKGWSEPDGTFQQRVVDVAGDADGGARVDPGSCRPEGPGEHQLCAVWRDPEFDPNRRAVYYARVLENPSCRYAAYACRERADAPRPAACSDPELPLTIQERAWTSPIWYTP